MNINKKELELLNGRLTPPAKGKNTNMMYNVAKGFLWFIYGLVNIICTTIEISFTVLCLLTLPKRRKRRKRKWF